MKKRTASLFLFILSIISCDRLAKNVEAPKIESQLVMFSFLSPEEDFVKIEVGMSKPVYGSQKGNNTAINNAIVTIINDGGYSFVVPFVDSLNAYYIPSSSYPIESGRTYTVTVSARGKSVSASCVVPSDIVSFKDITYQKLSASTSGIGSSPYYRYSYKWLDKEGSKNYYRVFVESQYSYKGIDDDSVASNYEVCTTLWDDENRDGNTLNGICEDYSFYGEPLNNKPISFYLLNTDVHYYEYHKRRLYYYGEDPFSEPVQQYSNVKNGLGVVCAYRKSKSILIMN